MEGEQGRQWQSIERREVTSRLRELVVEDRARLFLQ